MASRLKTLTAAYYKLSSLYKNPTRRLRGMAASHQDKELASQHAEMLALFERIDWGEGTGKEALYFKVLALLYEVDDYRGRVTLSVERRILGEPTSSVEYFNTRREMGDWRAEDFSDPSVRTLWKAKVLCCVAAVESRRKSSDSGALLRELNVLEEFVEQKLHKLDELPAWTTLAFVRTAQARVARQKEEYAYVRDKLLNVVECLDERAAEIIEKLTKHTEKLAALREPDRESMRGEGERAKLLNDIRRLEDNLVFIRQKHTLTILFSFGLDNLQRGFLDSAQHACHAARFLFRMHGHTYHRLFNELLMISIKRARMSRKQKNKFLSLERRLVKNILPSLEPKGMIGNSKLYAYGLRELAVIQLACDKAAETRATLRKMEQITSLGPQWKSRINLLHSRALYVAWRASGDIKEREPKLIFDSLTYCETAFKYATGWGEGIESHADAQSLLAFIREMGSRNLIDTAESLITYGTVQLFLKSYFDVDGDKVKAAKAVREARKSAEAVIELSGDDSPRLNGDDNPRLRAMGHLVLAEAYKELGSTVEARRELEAAKALETRIQHEYVKDRRRAIEDKIPTSLTLYPKDCGHINDVQDRVFGWYIDNCPDKSSITQIAACLEVSRDRVTSYIERQGSSSTYYHLLPDDPAQKKREGKKERIRHATSAD